MGIHLGVTSGYWQAKASARKQNTKNAHPEASEMKPRLGAVGWVAGKKSTLEKEKRGQSKQIS